MIIGLAQIRSENGEISRNVKRHLALLRSIGSDAADFVVFPELSLSNYAPDLAEASALQPQDRRLDDFQRFADETRTVVGVGAPLRSAQKPVIAMIVFAPGRSPAVVGKRYLHEDEAPFFSPAEGDATVLDLAVRVGVAICYEISMAAHADALIQAGAAVYLASAAKTVRGVATAQTTLAATARRHRIPALLVNSVGTCEGEAAGGGSMVIDRAGGLVHQLGPVDEGVLLYDTEKGTATARSMRAIGR